MYCRLPEQLGRKREPFILDPSWGAASHPPCVRQTLHLYQPQRHGKDLITENEWSRCQLSQHLQFEGRRLKTWKQQTCMLWGHWNQWAEWVWVSSSFPSLRTIDFLGWWILCAGGGGWSCLEHCKMLSSIPHLYRRKANSVPELWQPKFSNDKCPGGGRSEQNSPQLRTTVYPSSTFFHS